MPTPRPFTFYTDGTGIFYTVDGVNFIQVGGGAAGSIPLSELATQSQATVVGNPSGSGTQSPVALTQTQLTALINPATASLPGAMTAAQAAAVQQGHIPVTFDSRDFNGGAVLDLMTTTSNYLLTPTLTGYYAVPLVGSTAAIRFVGTVATGSTPTAPTGNIGNNSTTRNNWVASASGIVAISGFAAGAPYVQSLGSFASFVPLVDLATPVGIDITVAATTATAWKGYFLTTCYLYAH